MGDSWSCLTCLGAEEPPVRGWGAFRLTWFVHAGYVCVIQSCYIHWMGHFNMCMSVYGHMGTKELTQSSNCHFVKACCLTDTLRVSFF